MKRLKFEGSVLGIALATTTVACGSAGEVESWIAKNVAGSMQTLGPILSPKPGAKGGASNNGSQGNSTTNGTQGTGGADAWSGGSGGSGTPDTDDGSQGGEDSAWGGQRGGSTATGGTPSGSGGSNQNQNGRPPAAGGANAGRGGASAGVGGARPQAGGSNAGQAGGAVAAAGGSTSGGGTPVSVKKFVGNITTGDSADTDGRVFSKYWDQITPENAGKWGSVQSNASAAFNWTTLDAIYSYTQKNNIIFKQHTFVWGSQQPSGSITQANVQTWMTEFCKRYPNVKIIDVVNEPPPHTTPSYANSIGGGTDGTWQWIINAFKWAREACPNAILVLNDYNNIEWSTDATHFIDIAKKAKAGGAPIDAVGAQSHDLDHAQVTFASVKTLIENLHTQTGLPVYITEFDISNTDDNAQLEAYKQYFPFFMDTDYIQGVTVWGWIYGKTWSQAPNSGLIRSGTPRPAMTWLMQQLGRTAP